MTTTIRKRGLQMSIQKQVNNVNVLKGKKLKLGRQKMCHSFG